MFLAVANTRVFPVLWKAWASASPIPPAEQPVINTTLFRSSISVSFAGDMLVGVLMTEILAKARFNSACGFQQQKENMEQINILFFDNTASL
jgi:hypothetical protein